jgi:hypothetical protein
MGRVLDFIRKWFLPVGFALILIFSVGSFGVTAINGASTNQIVQQHNSDLQIIKQNTQITKNLLHQIKALQEEHSSDLSTITAESSEIHTIYNTITDNHNISDEKFNAICTALKLPADCGFPDPDSPSTTTPSTLPFTK